MPVDTPCVEWAGATTRLGYGQVMVNRKRLYVHRISYCDANGLTLADIAGKVVRHRCDNPACYRPEHLELGTQADNLKDMWLRGRGRANPEKGERNGNAKLTEAEVRLIKSMYVKGSAEAGCGGLARQFKVDRTQIHNIVTGKQWAHVQGDSRAS